MYRRLVGGLVLLVLVGPTSVQAQSPLVPAVEFKGTDWPDLLVPESGIADVKLKARIGCGGGQPGTNANKVEVNRGPAPSYAGVVLVPQSTTYTINPTSCTDPGYRTELNFALIVTTVRVAPAFERFTVPVYLNITSPDGMRFGPYRATSNFTNDYLAIVQVVPQSYFQRVEPGANFSFPVTITNLGNGETKVNASVQGPNGANVAVAPIRTVTLPARVGGETGDHVGSVWVNGTAPDLAAHENKIFSFVVRTVSASTDPRGTTTDETSFTLSIQVTGAVAGVPGLDVPANLVCMIGILGARTFGRRRP